MKTFLRSRDGASQGAALMIVLALVVLLTGLALAYFSRAGTDRQLAQSSYNDTSADLLARSALDIVVNDFKQEIISNPTVTRANIQPARYGDASIPNLIRRSFSGDPTNRTSSVPSTSPSANGRSISTTRWNSHYLLPRGNPSDLTINPSPTPSFIAPDWVLVTPQGPTPAPSPNAVIGRYAFAVYDEGGLLDMNLAGYPGWSSCNIPTPTPTPWLVNVGRKGIVAFADLTALGSYAPAQSQVDNIVGWRNYAMTQRTFTGFPSPSPSPIFPAQTDDCGKQDWYGSYLLDFGDPPFSIDSLLDKLLASIYPFTSAANYVWNNRTDQSLMTRQELLRLQRTLNNPPGQFSQNVLQYMGTFSRERNRPAPDWPGLNPTGSLSEGRFNLNNLAMVVPNPADCFIAHGKKKGWRTGKNKNHLCGDSEGVHKLLGLFWVKADVIGGQHPKGEWRYIGNAGLLPDQNGNPNPHRGIDCLRGANQQSDFFQILDFALFQTSCETNDNNVAKTFAIGASLIDQYDSGDGCPSSGQNTGTQPPGCDLDSHAVGSNWNKKADATHTTVIKWGHGNGNTATAYGMEPNYSTDNTNGDAPYDPNYGGNNPHRPTPAPTPGPNTQVISHAFSNVGELGYGIDTSTAGVPTLKFWDSTTTPPFQYAPVLDFFCYNPISSAYPRAGIVNLYTKNAPVLAAILSRTYEKDPGPTPGPSPTPVVSATDANAAANAIVAETQRVLAGTPTYGSVQQTDLTRAIAGRLAKAAFDAVPNLATSDETKETVARALAEMGQTRTWNLFIDVIAQTGRYAPDATNITQANNFIVEGEKRYWLHIALGRDLNPDGSVDVLGTQLEEVTE
jgi:hypothetical protein